MSNIEQFEKDLNDHLAKEFNASNQNDNIKKLSDAENTVYEFVNNYVKKYGLDRSDLNITSTYLISEFAKKKINYIE
ncbi:hypothetical protein [Flavobacterium humidisoli]|uniref:Uncharacterized protein n=1 Tax=Flavobacterium humidisoli TaxID=2937442 RepID=A0ABY4LRY0_9FLAO|nr:hypothetical protein [Flavobacterium humidisoli]UPZ14366.1 hypothetical protein M0M44_16555 [Flavobacterium humidisoli]